MAELTIAPRVKASTTIADQFRRRIASGDFRPGDPLPSERELVIDLGYSKPTVREALRILENEGLIEVKRGIRGGPQVRRLLISEVAKPMGTYLQIGDVSVADVCASRDRIVGAAIERLASSADVDLEILERQIDELESHVGDLSAFYLHLIATAEVAVALAGNATDHVVVVALRHVIELELAAATAAVNEASLDAALAAERDYAAAWRKVLRNVRAGRPGAARKAYEVPAAEIQEHLASSTVGMTVGEAATAPLDTLIGAHAAAISRASRSTLAARRRSSTPVT
jgi:DNA-binding FadR family transcriptional regulator